VIRGLVAALVVAGQARAEPLTMPKMTTDERSKL
jgi:hypothetical protein